MPRGWDARTHLRVTGQPNRAVIEFARRLHALGHPAWIRFVLVPGLSSRMEPPTDDLLQSVRDTFRRHGSICPG